MTRILVLYYSSYGHVRALAEAEAEGALSVAGTTVDIRRVPETVPEPVRQRAQAAIAMIDAGTAGALPAIVKAAASSPAMLGSALEQVRAVLE